MTDLDSIKYMMLEKRIEVAYHADWQSGFDRHMPEEYGDMPPTGTVPESVWQAYQKQVVAYEAALETMLTALQRTPKEEACMQGR